ncbi:MAG: SWIM zinc finger family protein, partial [Clostridiales bacterium]|nr:SWIM zinc finger family protein [Clostridiales bacterium]
MKIIEFEKLIEDKIVQRGRDYYKKGAVKNLELADEIAGVSSFCADVEGSEIYEVTAELSDEGEIISSECTCPYDMGEFCKHEVAVFYALSDQFSLAKDLKKPKKKSKAKLEISELLAEADKETLAEILLEYA